MIDKTEITRGLYSKSWRKIFNNVEAIVIEKDYYDKNRISEIIKLYFNRKEQFDKYFPRVLEIEESQKRFIYEYVSGQMFSSYFSFKRFLKYRKIPDLSYRIGQLLAAFHKEHIKSNSKTTVLEEYEERLKLFKKKYSHMVREQEYLDKLLREIERLKDEMICIWHDSTPWNIIITQDEDVQFIDYFDARDGLSCEDLWKYIFAIDLLKWDFYPPSILKKTISSFLQGYSEEKSIDKREYFLTKIIYEMFYLTYLVGGHTTFSRYLKQKYLEISLRKDLRNYNFQR